MSVEPQAQQDKVATALCVAVPEVWRAALTEMFKVLDADSAADALRTLRIIAIDLLVVGADLPDEPFWSLVARVRRARPQLAWVLVGDVSEADEVRARCLGVLMILGPDLGGISSDEIVRNRAMLAAESASEAPAAN